MNHDPWCDAVREIHGQVTMGAILDGGCPVCDLIARVRADERERVQSWGWRDQTYIAAAVERAKAEGP